MKKQYYFRWTSYLRISAKTGWLYYYNPANFNPNSHYLLAPFAQGNKEAFKVFFLTLSDDSISRIVFKSFVAYHINSKFLNIKLNIKYIKSDF